MSSLTSRLARRLLALAGWKVIYRAPAMKKAVIVFYPHTSNWDFVIGILARFAIALPVKFAAKDSLFVGPLGAAFRRLGGIPVNRRERTGFVTQMAAEFRRREEFYLAITPEGTRRLTSGWKSGFYRLALEAGVPRGLALIDYARREIGVVDYLALVGEEAADFQRIRQYYAGRQGRHPAQQGPVALLATEKPDRV